MQPKSADLSQTAGTVPDAPILALQATRPDGNIARLLQGNGIQTDPVTDDEGPVDRFIVSRKLAVERFTGTHFLHGIADKTLFASAIYLREHFETPVIIVEGRVNYDYRQFSRQAVQGALSALMLEYGMNVLMTADDAETAQLITMMARQDQIGIPEISLVPKRKAVGLADMQRRVIEMLPGCGRMLARELLRHFGSVEAILNAGPEDLRSIKGVGAKTAKQIIGVLHARYEAIDTERDLEEAICLEPQLLFDHPVRLLDRQHYIYSDESGRHFVDLLFDDKNANAVILVELKRGRLGREHEAQLKRYLALAGNSRLIADQLEKGRALRGMLATAEPCTYTPRQQNISAAVVDGARAAKLRAVARKPVR